jgi:hypothetical protein
MLDGMLPRRQRTCPPPLRREGSRAVRRLCRTHPPVAAPRPATHTRWVLLPRQPPPHLHSAKTRLTLGTPLGRNRSPLQSPKQGYGSSSPRLLEALAPEVERPWLGRWELPGCSGSPRSVDRSPGGLRHAISKKSGTLLVADRPAAWARGRGLAGRACDASAYEQRLASRRSLDCARRFRCPRVAWTGASAFCPAHPTGDRGIEPRARVLETRG